jgi:hypothetical protein
MYMFHADARQAGYFRIGENFLARLYRNQRALDSPPSFVFYPFDATWRLKDAQSLCNSRSVSFREQTTLLVLFLNPVFAVFCDLFAFAARRDACHF